MPLKKTDHHPLLSTGAEGAAPERGPCNLSAAERVGALLVEWQELLVKTERGAQPPVPHRKAVSDRADLTEDWIH
ncbi:hypothetical protein IHE44_0011916 [Lamprotornis superbus]|uniref:Uncharacterized protein n=1 Tax=Lamprotornis superbus TaxID=245042 RepID=A0A835U046_9PASS|nr:hypothetical protein IHE44_0011916 [Lamprotornis superbus]